VLPEFDGEDATASRIIAIPIPELLGEIETRSMRDYRAFLL